MFSKPQSDKEKNKQGRNLTAADHISDQEKPLLLIKWFHRYNLWSLLSKIKVSSCCHTAEIIAEKSVVNIMTLVNLSLLLCLVRSICFWTVTPGSVATTVDSIYPAFFPQLSLSHLLLITWIRYVQPVKSRKCRDVWETSTTVAPEDQDWWVRLKVSFNLRHWLKINCEGPLLFRHPVLFRQTK